LSDQRRQIAKEDCIAEMGQRVAPHENTCSRGGLLELPGSRTRLHGGFFTYTTRYFRRPERLTGPRV
jgi:hypothetical protein